MKLWLTTTENKYFMKILWHLLGEYVKTTILLVCSIYTVHHFFYFLFLFFPNHQFVLFFYRIVALFIQRFSLFIYSFILVSHFVFFFFSFLFLSFSLWLTTIENKCFVKMLWHLLGEYVKTTILLVCSICTVHRFFYFIFSQSSICALFSTEFLHCSYNVFHCSSTIPFWLATLSSSFFFLFFFYLSFEQ